MMMIIIMCNFGFLWREKSPRSCNGRRTVSALTTAPSPLPNLTLRLTIIKLIKSLFAPLK